LISERERPNDRMETVGADDEIESAWQCITEGDVHTVLVLLKCRDGIAEEPLNLLIKLPMKQIDEVAAKDLDLRDEALSPKSVCRHGGADPTARIDPGHACLVEADRACLVEQPCTIDDGATCSAQVHGLTTRQRTCGDFDDRD